MHGCSQYSTCVTFHCMIFPTISLFLLNVYMHTHVHTWHGVERHVHNSRCVNELTDTIELNYPTLVMKMKELLCNCHPANTICGIPNGFLLYRLSLPLYKPLQSKRVQMESVSNNFHMRSILCIFAYQFLSASNHTSGRHNLVNSFSANRVNVFVVGPHCGLRIEKFHR